MTLQPSATDQTYQTCCAIQFAHVLLLNVAEAQHGEAQVRDQDASHVADATLEDQLAMALWTHRHHSCGHFVAPDCGLCLAHTYQCLHTASVWPQD